jgi:uncharacterized RDD family membrane protein YckC
MPNYSEASHGRQLSVGLIDATLPLAVISTLLITGKPEVIYSCLESINGSLLVLIALVFYRLLSLLFFNQTLGMRLFDLVLLNREEQPLSLVEKSLAAIFVLYRGVSYYQVK